MANARNLGLAALLLSLSRAVGAADAPAISVSLAGVSGGDTNDVQLSYGGGLGLFSTGRFSASAEVIYVRDFFEFEPDAPLDDAAVYSDVIGVLATARFRLRASASGPYLLAGPAWLRSRALSRTSDQAGIEAGAGWLLPTRSRLQLRLETRYFGSLSGSGQAPPGKRYSFWRYGLELSWSLARPTAPPP